MLTQNEITALSLSPTKKDFVQIWNELLEVAGKLSERWDPASTNESDPGIVILKALAGIADKLNYNIDKNILEAFMPTAAQEDSMRKLCDMLGYNMKYYRSAETDVTIKYYNSDPDDDELAAMTAPGQLIPKFTVITNIDKDISYFTINQTPIYLSVAQASATLPCMEGQIVKCESNNANNIITANQVSENNRFYLPETMVAENGIFIYNVKVDAGTLTDGERWEMVDNLNVRARDSRVFKFGYDSYESRPYVEFPEDYSKLFNEGVFLYYARTSGANGNVSRRALTQIELPSGGNWSSVSAESLSVENVFAATSGANAETIKQAYNNFKKTVGTFETLVTCRDYMNKIYSFVESGKPLVSNILVTDIRSDINRAVNICSCDDAGIFYKDVPLTSNIPVHENTKPVFAKGEWHLGSADGITLPESFVKDASFIYTKTGKAFVSKGYWYIKQEDKDYKTELQVGEVEQAVNNFDIVFYPFKSYSQIRSNIKDIRAVYDASFAYTETPRKDIEIRLNDEELKTISHNIKYPNAGDILSINNYLRLSATIATNSKVTVDEGTLIKDNIKKALANAFNMHELDFGNTIPFDSIVEVIEGADNRIKVASLNEPALYTTYSVLERRENNAPVVLEYAVASDWLDVGMSEKIGRFTKTDKDKNTGKDVIRKTFDTHEAREIYNKLVVRNILAGRVPLFNYNNSFTSSFSESSYQVTSSANKPDKMPEPKAEQPFIVWADGDTVYTGKHIAEDADPVYTKTETKCKGNVITEAKSKDKVDNYITGLKADCKVLADESGKISDVTLADGEFVRFRAKNFKTIKTYPAYVNYRLELANNKARQAEAAVAESLFDILNADIAEYSESNTNIRWQKVLDYFSALDEAKGHTSNKDTFKKTFRLEQTVSAFNETEEAPATSAITTLGIELANNQAEPIEYTPEQLMSLSGCVKLKNSGYKAYLEWLPEDGAASPAYDLNTKIEVVLSDFDSPFITNINVLSSMKAAIDNTLYTYRDVLPAECSWKVSFEFECVPFEARSLPEWVSFITEFTPTSAKAARTDALTSWKPVVENNTIFWRTFGDGYEPGKYVTQNTEKLLPFTQSYFGLLPDVRLSGIYLIKEMGADTTPVAIENNTEYMLGTSDHLYIEYTPSTTTDSDAATAITEVYGQGTIIRPIGFAEVGLVDSGLLSASSYKTVTFNTPDGIINKEMYRLGAGEQIEIRDFAKVTVSKDDFPTILIYKNFNCPALEEGEGPRKYTLKDGEAIFYTDTNKSEFAYFTTGTEVELRGKITLNQFDVIELSTILDSGIHEIPWATKQLTGDDAIIFQEYQYITLGKEDTIKALLLCGTEDNPINEYTDATGQQKMYLNDVWKACDEVTYVLAGDPDNSISLPPVHLQENTIGNGWEVSSTFELNVASNVAQALRSTDSIVTSLKPVRTQTDGGDATDPEEAISPESTGSVLSFKTNLACQSCGNEISIDDVWSNPDELKGFQVKVFTPDAPVIVKTKPETVIPYDIPDDFATWSGEPIKAKEYLSLWSSVSLEAICPTIDSVSGKHYDQALRLPICLLPNTYGIFCINVQKTSDAEVWLEVIPGTKPEDVSVLNDIHAHVEYETIRTNAGDENSEELRVFKKIYLNQGINCIRVNDIGRIFVKASSGATGALYFDELRLVNCRPIEYSDSTANKPVAISTQGLNLAQLGYLDASEDSDDKISKDVKDRLQKIYVAEMFASANEDVQDSETTFLTKYTDLLNTAGDKVKYLVTKEREISTELATIKAMASTDRTQLTGLLTQYRNIKDTLQKEKELLEALKNNTDADNLAQSLIDLLNSFASTEAQQQEILKELAKLKAAAANSLADISDDTIIKDFKAFSYDGADATYTAVDAEIRAKALRLIEESYQEQLVDIAEFLNASVNSTSKDTLLGILNELKASATASDRAKMQALVNELGVVVENEIGSILEEIESAAYQEGGVDYQRLMSLLTQLSNVSDSTSIAALVSEISQAITDSNDEHLKALLADLFKDGSFVVGTVVTDATVTNAIKAVENAVNAANAEGVKSAVSALKSAVKKVYDDSIKALFESLNKTFNNLNQKITSIDNILANLSKAENNSAAGETAGYVQKAATQLMTAINQRANRIGWLEELDTAEELREDSSVTVFVEKAVLEVWPQVMQSRHTGIWTNIEKVFNAALAGERKPNSQALYTKTDLTNVYSRETVTLKRILNTPTIELLFDNVTALLDSRSRYSSEATQIEDIGELLKVSEDLSSAFDSFNDASSIISSLINDWKKTKGVRQKQKLLMAMKSELISAVDTHSKLFGVVSGALCPKLTSSIAELEGEDDNSFYARLKAELAKIETTLVGAAGSINTIDSLSIVDDTKYQTLLDSSFTDFKAALSAFNLPGADSTGTLLTNDFVEELTAMKALLGSINSLNTDLDTLKTKGLEHKTKDEIEALYDGTGITSTFKESLARKYLEELSKNISTLESRDLIADGYVDAFKVLRLEEQLLDNIRAIDVNREFYYNAPIASGFAIDLNDSNSSLNTLMNPQMNYDINNVNNNFVISKLDIDFLDSGIQIARSSRLS